MKKLDFAGLALAVAGALARMWSRQPPLVVNIKAEGAGGRVTVEGRQVSQKELLELGVESKSRRAIVVYEKAAPYVHVAATIITLQQAGLNKVDSVIWNET